MLTYGALSFVAPAALLGFLSLPILWWLLRVIPPAPRRIRFPAVRLIMQLVNPEESSAKTPLWLAILRIVALSLIILAAAHPLMNAGTEMDSGGPLVLVIDDDWAAARNWDDRQTVLANLIDQAERENRAVAVVTTAPDANAGRRNADSLLTAEAAREIVLSLKPKPWPGDRDSATAILNDLKLEGPANVVWLSNGIDQDNVGDFSAALSKLGRLTVLADLPGDLPLVLLPPVGNRDGLTIKAARAVAGGPSTRRILARDERGGIVARKEIEWKAGDREGSLRLDLPVEIRNRLAHLEIEGEGTAAATVLVDERWRRRPVGLFSGSQQRKDQPLLDELYYLGRALDPFTEVRTGGIAELMKRELALIVLADPGRLIDADRNRLNAWIEAGGIVIRFAGPRLASDVDDLLPVRLRKGDRELGGALSWTKPIGLAPFPETSPFTGIEIPKDVLVRRQVLAQPTVDLPKKTWARLADGTPLVTAEKRGNGWLTFVHTTGSPAWSNLAISGVFVEMLQNLVQLSRGVVGEADNRALAPIQSIDGFGRLTQPLPGSRAMTAQQLAENKPGPEHPPGFYGDASARRAFNLSPAVTAITPLGNLTSGLQTNTYEASRETDLRPWLLTLALVLVIVDIFASLALRGYLTLARTTAAMLMILLAGPVWAQTAGGPTDDDILAVALKLRLGYIETGDAEVDRISRAGLAGLSFIANSRTAADLGEPLAVDPAIDELVFSPLIYWPITENAEAIGPTAAKKLNAYLKRGGTILIDTRDQGNLVFDTPFMRDLARQLEIPPLRAIASDHVLTKAYYLLRNFPGRWTGGRVWVERDASRTKDGVSSIIVGSHDWAAAWAIDDARKPMLPVVPGGERQREMAYRFGINLLMYVLTGNYKADQVHLPAILERLGQ